MSNDCLDVTLESIQQKVNEFGCNIIHIPADEYNPGFAYTIGLYQRFKHPEIICFSLKQETLHGLLNDACTFIQQGKFFRPGGIPCEDLLNNYDVQFLRVDKSYHPNYLGFANWFYQNQDYPAIQLVWPDKQGIFPWEEGFNPKLQYTQPLLDRNMDFKFREKRNLGVFTTKQVFEGRPIVYVSHNHDGDWQFHSESEPSLGDAFLVTLEQITKLDPSINEVFHLNYGEYAWRETKNDSWQWDKSPEEEEEEDTTG